MNKTQLKQEALNLILTSGKQGAQTEYIAHETGKSLDVVISALRSLKSEGLIRKKPDLMDMRRSTHYYSSPYIVFRIVKEDEPPEREVELTAAEMINVD